MKKIVFALFMVVTGVTNLMCAKYSDTLRSENLDGNIVQFNQQFLTSCGTFFGQIICSILFYFVLCPIGKCCMKKFGDQTLDSERPQPFNYNPWIFWPLAFCEVMSAFCQYLASTMTYPPLLQVLRGLSILFTGILSRIYFGRRLHASRWIGIAFLIAGKVIYPKYSKQ